jgi:hypothetical protein
MDTEEKYYRIYSLPDCPDGFFDVYYAVDKEGWSVRSVEVKENGSIYLADELIQIGDTFLPEASIYPLNREITEGYKTEEIDIKKFNQKWSEAISFAREHKLRPVLTGVIY